MFFTDSNTNHESLLGPYSRGSKNVGRAPQGALDPLGGAIVCMRDIFILNEIWTKIKYIF
jgi:hypothetical protein